MRASIFPNPETADENGIVCVGGHLSAPLLLEAYGVGIFPWPDSSYPEMLWFSPDPRGVLPLKNLHVSASLQKWAKKSEYQVVLNQDFSKIVKACGAAVRSDQPGTWITKDIIRGYSELFELGFAYCVGVYDGNELVGGMYGVCIDQFVSAESMFFTKTNASKLALWRFCEFLIRHKIEWVDIQMVTPVSENFGGEYISRSEFLRKLPGVLGKIQSPKWHQSCGL